MLLSLTRMKDSPEMCVQRIRLSNGRGIASPSMILGAGNPALLLARLRRFQARATKPRAVP